MRPVDAAAEDLWPAYLECRFRNLYAPYNLPRTCTTSELDQPPARAGIHHRAIVVDAGEVSPRPSDVIRVGASLMAACRRLDVQLERPEGPSAQLRYFAVDVPFRGSGSGQALLRHLEDLARSCGCKRLWMEARCEALNFYTRQGYADFGEGPTKWGVIPHRLLHKAL
jgi:GNAT superfamily N-acetyltransferase